MNGLQIRILAEKGRKKRSFADLVAPIGDYVSELMWFGHTEWSVPDSEEEDQIQLEEEQLEFYNSCEVLRGDTIVRFAKYMTSLENDLCGYRGTFSAESERLSPIELARSRGEAYFASTDAVWWNIYWKDESVLSILRRAFPDATDIDFADEVR